MGLLKTSNSKPQTPNLLAQMAELVDALDSKSGYRKVVQVRFLFWALKEVCIYLIINVLQAFLFSLVAPLVDLLITIMLTF